MSGFMGEKKFYSFLHVVKPEVDLPVDIDLYSQPVYDKARENINMTPGAELEYLEARSYPGLQIVDDYRKGCLIAVAVYFGEVRLIDNILIENVS